MAGEAIFTKKRRLNIVDVILILIIILAVAGLSYILIGNKLSPASNYEVTYTVVVPFVKNEIADKAMLLKKGDKVIDSVRSHQIGELVDIKVEPAVTNVTNQMTGVVTEELYPEHSKITLTVKSDCDKDGEGYTIKGYDIYIGMQVHFRTEHFVNYGNCNSMVVTEKAKAAATGQEG